MDTSLKYLSNSYLDKNQTVITAVFQDECATAVYCQETIFYPQGGGQPSDTGIISIKVSYSID